MALVYLNGHLVEEAKAMVSVFDHGLTTGDGVFESILVTGGKTFAMGRHLDRLERSVAIIGLPLPDRTEMEQAVGAVVESAGYDRAKVRVTVTGGTSPLGSNRGSAAPSIIVAVEELPPAPAGEPARWPGVSVVLAPWRRTGAGPVAGAKTISYVDNVVALAWAHERGANEAVFANEAGNLCEGTGSNVFVVLDDQLLTPPLASGCLAGVTRGLVVELTGADEHDVPVARLGDVDEAFLTSTTRGVLPISVLDGRRLGSCPGRRTVTAATMYAGLLAKTLEP